LAALLLQETWISNQQQLRNWINTSQIKEDYNIISDTNLGLDSDSQLAKAAIGQGTAIIIHKDWQRYQHKIFIKQGRVTAIWLKRNGENIMIASIYIPVREDNERAETSKFIIEMKKAMPPKSTIIMMGDWNGTMNPSLDKWAELENKTIINETKNFEGTYRKQ
jgi:exonuclease III